MMPHLKKYDSDSSSVRHLENKLAGLERANAQLKNQLEDARQETRYYQKLVGKMTNPVVVCRLELDETGTPSAFVVDETNAAFEEMVGNSQKTMTGKQLSTILPGNQCEFFLQSFSDVALSGIPKFQVEYDHNGERYFTLNAFQSQPMYIVLVFSEITRRVYFENKLEESENRLRQMTENIREAICLRTRNKVLYVNPSYEKLFGLSEKALYKDANSFFNAIHPKDLTEAKRVLSGAISDTPEEREHQFRIIHPDKGIRWIYLRVIPITQEGSEYRLVAVADDVTEWKNAVDDLAKRESMLAEAENLVNLGSWEYDLKHRKLILSDGLRRMLGIGKEKPEASLKYLLQFVYSEDHAILSSLLRHTLKTGESYSQNIRLISQSNEIRYIHIKGAIIRDSDGRKRSMLGSVIDMTEQRIMERRLRNSQASLLAMIDATDDVAFLMDQNKRILLANDALTLHVQKEYSDLIGQSVDRVFPKPFALHLREMAEKAVKYLEANLSTTVIDDCVMETRVCPVKNTKGEITRFAVFSRDITELKMKEALELESEKLSTAAQLSATIAHEFNNPLAILKGAAELIASESIDFDSKKRHIEKIPHQVERMAELVQKLLTLNELKEIHYAAGMKILNIHGE